MLKHLGQAKSMFTLSPPIDSNIGVKIPPKHCFDVPTFLTSKLPVGTPVGSDLYCQCINLRNKQVYSAIAHLTIDS